MSSQSLWLWSESLRLLESHITMTSKTFYIALAVLFYCALFAVRPVHPAGRDGQPFDVNAPASARPSDVLAKISHVTGDLPRVVMRKSVQGLEGAAMADLVQGRFKKKYNQVPRPLQIDSVVSLAQGISTFVLAGTGYGKTRIPQAFLDLFTVASMAIVVVVNALDALGDNQVSQMEVVPGQALKLIVLT